jgi:hypothetical protein
MCPASLGHHFGIFISVPVQLVKLCVDAVKAIRILLDGLHDSLLVPTAHGRESFHALPVLTMVVV